ncbi:MAG: hypothetical protein HY718_11260, partial [Planctomycetes bacterium]|nr:hypothetical protein [Planctomycetota bacterium]
LMAGVTHYWRIDEVNVDGTTAGDVWRFRTGRRPTRADFDGDLDVDMDDFGHMQSCLTGTGVPQYDAACADARIDDDLDVDEEELAFFLDCLSGAGITAAAGCVEVVQPADPIRPRPAGAALGSEFIDEVKDLTLTAREARILTEAASGNIPPFLRTFVPVTVSTTIGGTPHTATYQVMPDYLCIGSDADFTRMPMRPTTAQVLADKFECLLPTRKMVNDIYTQAAIKLAPAPISPTTVDITLVTTFYQHHQMVEEQRAGYPLGPPIGGIKKDVVVTPQLASRPGHVAIYGWHQLNGVPIQPLYLGHVDTWVDYSHGIRMVKGYLMLDGVTVPVADVLRDSQLNVLLSDEGVVDNPRY